MVESEEVTVERLSAFVAAVEMHRPPNNFFDGTLIKDVADAVDELDRDPDCRAIVLCSEGKHFCAGAALKSEGDGDRSQTVANLYVQCVRLFSGSTPIVAAIQGGAIGGGLGLALVADFRVATPDARFSANFARLGFHHGFGLTITLPQVVGHQRALELLYTGRRVAGKEAFGLGLCDRLTEAGTDRDAALQLATEIATSAPLAVSAIRQTLRGHLSGKIKAATDRELEEQTRLRLTDDFAEGVKAMAERRSPEFHGQ